MKKIIEKIKSLAPDNNKKVAIYFVFYFIFFLIILFVVTANNFFGSSDNKKECVEDKKETIQDTKNNYGFRYEIDIAGSSIVLSGSRNNNEYKIDKRLEGLLTNYYIYYGDIYKLDENNKWIKYDGKIIDNFDMKLINIDYLGHIVKKSEVKENTKEKTIYYYSKANITIEVVYKNGESIDYLKVIKGDTSIIIRHFDKGKISEFDIDIEE